MYRFTRIDGRLHSCNYASRRYSTPRTFNSRRPRNRFYQTTPTNDNVLGESGHSLGTSVNGQQVPQLHFINMMIPLQPIYYFNLINANNPDENYFAHLIASVIQNLQYNNYVILSVSNIGNNCLIRYIPNQSVLIQNEITLDENTTGPPSLAGENDGSENSIRSQWGVGSASEGLPRSRI